MQFQEMLGGKNYNKNMQFQEMLGGIKYNKGLQFQEKLGGRKFNKDIYFQEMLGGIKYNQNGDIIGAGAVLIKFYTSVNVSAVKLFGTASR